MQGDDEGKNPMTFNRFVWEPSASWTL